MPPTAELGVFGGSGFYSLLDDVEEVRVATPYGEPSDALMVGRIGERSVAFLPRHGRDHTIPPHRINYRANLWAMRELGVRRVLGPCAVGSLDPAIPPGAFVVCDQYVDRTSGRADTFYDGPEVAHVSAADPYCPDLRRVLVDEARAQGIDVRDGGTMVVIQGPRFSTRAESRWFRAAGFQIINMTGYPEAHLARELELCYASVGLVTDYDVGVEGAERPVSTAGVLEVFRANNARLRDLLLAAIPRIGAAPPDDPCPRALADAIL